MTPPRVSIIIPTKTVDAYTRESVAGCRRLAYPDFEIIVLPDVPGEVEGARVVVTGPVSPGRKRNLGARAATGGVLAFIDSDAYPDPAWLANAVRHLETAGVAAVGGPGVTPPEDNEVAQAQGKILSSFLVGRELASRYDAGRPIETDDIASCNFIARRDAVEAVGGWNEQYWPGEDTLICRALRNAGHKQLLAPDVVVYHHRRPTWKGYLRQIWNYSVHRGFFAKRFPETSRRATYFLPSLLLAGVVLGPPLAWAYPVLWWPFAAALGLYLILILWVAARSQRSALKVAYGIPLTHFTYGIGFLKGLMARRLTR